MNAEIYIGTKMENNPGPCTYGVIVVCDNSTMKFSGGYRHTTVQRIHLLACLEGINSALGKSPSGILDKVTIFTDFQSLLGITQKSIKTRLAQKFYTGANTDLYRRIDDIYGSSINNIFIAYKEKDYCPPEVFECKRMAGEALANARPPKGADNIADYFDYWRTTWNLSVDEGYEALHPLSSHPYKMG